MKKLIVSAMLVLMAMTAQAAKITQNADTIFYEGTVAQGDADRLEVILKNTKVRRISLSSRGGVAIEAYKLGYLFSDYDVTVYIAPDQYCLSACAVATQGAAYKDIQGLLGFHVAWTKSKGTMTEGMRQGQSLATLDSIYNFNMGYKIHLQYIITNWTTFDTFLILSQDDLALFKFDAAEDFTESAGISATWLEQRLAGPLRLSLKMQAL